MNSSQYFAAFLCAFGLSMVVWHLAEWAVLRRREERVEERGFGWRRFLRRMEASALIFVLGGAIFAGDLIPDAGTTAILYWSTVMLVVLLIGVLALADLMAIQEHFRREAAALHQQRHALEAEARQLQARTGTHDGSAAAPPAG